MELKEQLEIVDVNFEDNKKCTIIFLDEEMGEIREVNFNRQKWDQDSKKFVDDEEKAKRLRNGVRNILNCHLKDLQKRLEKEKMCIVMTISTVCSLSR